MHTVQMKVSEKLRRLMYAADDDALLAAVGTLATEWIGVEQVLIGRKTADTITINHCRQGGERLPFQLTLREGEGIAGWVLLYQTAYLAPDAANDPQISAELIQQLDCKTILAVPIKTEHQFFGVLQLHNRRDGRPFDEKNIQQATVLAEQMAYVLHNHALTSKAQQRSSALETLLEFSADLNAFLHVDALIERLIEYAMALLAARAGLGGVFAEDRPIVLASSRDFSVESTIAHWLAQQRQPYLTANYATDPFHTPALADEFSHMLAMPIVSEETVLGWFELFDKRDGTPFTWDDVALGQSLANIAAVALQNSYLFQELNVQRQQLRRLSADLVTRHEQERQRLARELHDETGQSLVGIKLELSVLEKRIADSQPELRNAVRRARQQVNAAATRLSAVSHGLRPPTLDELGLQSALENLVSQIESRSGLVIVLETDLPSESLASDVAITCYRLVQEALTNVVRHAQATVVTVRMACKAGVLRLHVVDDGVGFSVAAVRPNALGLLGMRERVAMLGGDFSIESGGDGTRISVRIPL